MIEMGENGEIEIKVKVYENISDIYTWVLFLLLNYYMV